MIILKIISLKKELSCINNNMDEIFVHIDILNKKQMMK